MRNFVAALTLSASLPAVALGQTASPSPPSSQPAGPIAVTTCALLKDYGQVGLGNLYVNGKAYNFFKVGFVNDGHVDADRIVFQIDFAKSRYVIGDDGTYAPGIGVTHVYRDHGKDVVASARPPGNDGSTVCSVLSVRFADGTTWTAPAPAGVKP
ncbi:MAG TPA: hypothetical protein VMF61_10280 [Candidatus Acidoferrales bacterium]|nr:hypothetical protein [Candidatus Acidoferrales bacterium]